MVDYEEHHMVDDDSDTDDGGQSVSDLEFRDTVKRSQVDLLLTVFNLWRSVQVVHEDFKTSVEGTKDQEIIESIRRLERRMTALSKLRRDRLVVGLVGANLVGLVVLYAIMLMRWH
jgi:hypothetical protein